MGNYKTHFYALGGSCDRCLDTHQTLYEPTNKHFLPGFPYARCGLCPACYNTIGNGWTDGRDFAGQKWGNDRFVNAPLDGYRLEYHNNGKPNFYITCVRVKPKNRKVEVEGQGRCEVEVETRLFGFWRREVVVIEPQPVETKKRGR
jgi:hypothetical protein